LAPSEVNVGRSEVIDAFMMTLVVVMIDEGADPGSQFIREEVVFQQDFVLQSLMPSLNLTLGLQGMIVKMGLPGSVLFYFPSLVFV
jgi:hypothetical protein